MRSFYDRALLDEADVVRKPGRVDLGSLNLGAARRPPLTAPRIQVAPARRPTTPATTPATTPTATKPSFGQRVAGGVLALSHPDAPERANEAARQAAQAVAKKASEAKARAGEALGRAGEAIRGKVRAVGQAARTAVDPERANQALTSKLQQWSGQR